MNPVDEAIYHVQEEAIVIEYNQFPDFIQCIKDLSLFKICLVTRNENIVVKLFFKLLKLTFHPFKSQSPPEFPYIQVVTLDDATPQGISHFQSNVTGDKRITIPVTPWPKTHPYDRIFLVIRI